MIVLKVDMLVKPGMEEKCKEYIRILQEHSRKEPGCLMYVGHQSIEDSRKFFFYEQYKDQERAGGPSQRSVLSTVCERRAGYDRGKANSGSLLSSQCKNKCYFLSAMSTPP